jgi:exodeoxyribonuclease III
MRVITLNVNGIRSAHRKGFFDWMLNQEADLICLQEIKAKPDELSPAITSPAGYLGYFHRPTRAVMRAWLSIRANGPIR